MPKYGSAVAALRRRAAPATAPAATLVGADSCPKGLDFGGLLSVAPGQHVGVEYISGNTQAVGIALFHGARAGEDGVEAEIEWLVLPGEWGTRRTHDTYENEVYVLAEEQHEWIEASSITSTVRVFNSLDEWQENGSANDFFQFGEVTFSEASYAPSNPAGLRPNAPPIARVTRWLPVKEEKLKPAPAELLLSISTQRASLQVGVGLRAVVLKGGMTVLPTTHGSGFELVEANPGVPAERYALTDKQVKYAFSEVQMEVAVCCIGEREVMQSLFADGQLVLVGLKHAKQVFSPPGAPVWAVLSGLANAMSMIPRMRAVRERELLQRLIDDAVKQSRAQRDVRPVCVSISASVIDVAALSLFLEPHAHRRLRGKYYAEVEAPERLPLPAGWTYFSISSKRQRASAAESFYYAEIVTRKTSPPDPKDLCTCELFTDFRSQLGIRFHRRKWKDETGASRVFDGGPQPPFAGYVPC